MNDYKTVRETCAEIGICRTEVYNRLWRGQLESEKHGKYRMIKASSIRRSIASQSSV
jgi:hypothetical protein